jgi:hypothetical protein
LGGARVVLKNISEFFRTTSVSKLEFRNIDISDLLADEISVLPRSLPTEQKGNHEDFLIITYFYLDIGKTALKRFDSIKERYSKQFTTIQQASLRHRSIVMDNNDGGKLEICGQQILSIFRPCKFATSVREESERCGLVSRFSGAGSNNS